MGLTATERSAQLGKWIKPSSDSEKSQQDRAESMVRNAIKASADFAGVSYKIYTKGSYPNNTNVRQDSDVDVVVELHEYLYYDYFPGIVGVEPQLSPYGGAWTPAKWRAAVLKALVAGFGAPAVDSSGKIAIEISAVAGSRPSADVVPSIQYKRYDNAERTAVHEGSCVFPTDGGGKVVNWPQQQLDNGRALNTASGGRYKYYVRALKNAENAFVKSGDLKELPSYFMECLVYNVPAATLKSGDLSDGFRATLVALWKSLEAEVDGASMVEPNELKYLFRGKNKWSLQDGKDLVLKTWNYFGYGD